MITLKLKQGSDEWHQFRLENFTASEAAAMMGKSKYMSRNELLKLKKTGNQKPVNPSMQAIFDKGHAAEALARPIAEELIDDELYPVTGILENTKLSASFDGLTMMNDIVFEHKLWNETLAENVRNGVLEPHYYWQLEQQLLVSGASRAIFMVSDGTKDKMEHCSYICNRERRQQLIVGWAQFEKDLSEYQVEAIKEKAIAQAAESFPLITYQVAGTEISSNITDCLDVITQRSQIEIARVLETDQDFADKDQLNKATKKARADLKSMVQEVQGKFISYSEFATVAAQIDSVLQKMQSHGEKQVKQAKSEKKQAIERSGLLSIRNHIDEINKNIDPIRLDSIFQCQVDLIEAMKNKRTIESLQCAVDDVVAQFKSESNQVAERVKVNLTTLRELAGEYKFLFKDTPQLVIKDNEDLVAVIKTRISDHKIEEEKKLEAQREKIREEEEVKARKKIADEQAETQRLEAEERLKAKRLEEQNEIAIDNANQEKSVEPAKEEPEEIVVHKETLQEEITESFLPEETAKQQQEEVKPESPSIEEVKGFLEWVVSRPDLLDDFGYLLLSNDAHLEEEAISNIKSNFTLYITD